jgi:predicted ATPase with chaperone activity
MLLEISTSQPVPDVSTRRADNRLLQLSKAMADLGGSENVCTEHLAEVIQYRSFDRSFYCVCAPERQVAGDQQKNGAI